MWVVAFWWMKLDALSLVEYVYYVTLRERGGVKVLLCFILNFSDFLTKFVTGREGGVKNGYF